MISDFRKRQDALDDPFDVMCRKARRSLATDFLKASSKLSMRLRILVQRLAGDDRFRNTILENLEILLAFAQRQPDDVVEHLSPCQT